VRSLPMARIAFANPVARGLVSQLRLFAKWIKRGWKRNVGLLTKSA
jgi:hypothetical protein